MSCLVALDSQFVTLLSVPHEILFLQHKVFREYAKIAVGPDFIHTLPSFLILMSMAIVLWRNPPSCNGLAQAVAFAIFYRALQLLVSWVVVIAALWMWLMLQRLLYCSVWVTWNYVSRGTTLRGQYEHQDTPGQWWQRVWSSYDPPPSPPPVLAADFISWLVTMSIATTVLVTSLCTNRLSNFIMECLTRTRNGLVLLKCWADACFKRTLTNVLETYWPLEQHTIADKTSSSICDECRSEISSDLTSQSETQVHPISYGTNWMPKPNFSGYRQFQRKGSMMSLHTVAAVANDTQDSDDLSPRQLRYKRGCHTVIPRNASDQSSDC